MNVLVIDKTVTPEMGEALKDCVVGQPKTITMTITPTVHDDANLVAKIDSVEYSEPVEEEASPAPEAPAKRAYKPKGGAVEVV